MLLLAYGGKCRLVNQEFFRNNSSVKVFFRLVLWLVMLFLIGYTLFSFAKDAATTLPDFTIFYQSTKDAVNHISPYTDKTLFTAFNYPLATTLFFLPLIIFSLPTAQIIFTVLSILGICASLFLSFALMNKRLSLFQFFLIFSLVLFAFPTKFTLGMGQTNFLAFAFLLGGFVLYQKKRMLPMTFLLLTAIFLKPILALTMLVFFFEKKRQLFFALFSAGFSIFLLAPLLFSQPQANVAFVQNMLHQSLTGREIYYNQGFLGFVARLTTSMQIRIFAEMTSFLFAIIFIYRFFRKNSLVQNLSLMLTLLVLIDPLSWQHHFIFLFLPFLFVYFAMIKQKQHIFFFLFAVSYILVAGNIKSPQSFFSFPLVLLLSNQFYGALLVFLLQCRLI